MKQLIAEEKITYVGSSNFADWDIAAPKCGPPRNLLWLPSEQSLYNLTQRTVELEVIPALRHFGMGPIPKSDRDETAKARALETAKGAGRRCSCSSRSTDPQGNSTLNRF